MALDASRLADEIAPELEQQIRTAILSGSATPYPNLTAFCQAVADSIATKVVAEITTNAEVTTTIDDTWTGTVSGGSCEIVMNDEEYPGVIT